MPIYHFNVYHDVARLDRDGIELPNVDAAWGEATTTAGEMIERLDGSLRPGHDWRMEVTDEFQNPLLELLVKARKK